MNHYALLYHVTADYLERRTQYRTEHLRLAEESAARGELALGGALNGPVDTALLIFRGEDDTAAHRFAENDPYVIHGLVTRYEVRPWTVVTGFLR